MARFTYTGNRTLIYFQYLDLDAQRTLVADPGESYDMVAVESGLSVPPGDGRWVISAPAKALPAPTASSGEKKAG